MVRVGIDIGGTFTDVVAETSDGCWSVKVLTSTQNPEVAALDGLERVLTDISKSYSDIKSIVHGTTLATNALIERKGAKTAFVTTAGFRDVLAMRYEKRFEQYALDIEMPEPLIPRPLRLGLTERVLADGTVLIAPSNAEIEELATKLSDQLVEAVAIGFLHSYKNPAHEIYVAEQLRRLLGTEVTLCLSHEVAGEIREYERFSTVCANAYVRPLMSQYVTRLLNCLKDRGFGGSFLMMLSDGALTTVDQASRFPIRLVEGGPAGGVALAAHVAREVGSSKTLSLDIGGTTAKICFIEKGSPKTNRRFEVARAWRDIKGSGLPVKVPTVELVEIGAGGGSIAKVDKLGRLRVGPTSAGSEPGPASYSRGGVSPTVTDAHLLLKNISTNGFAGGLFKLNTAMAHEVISNQLQFPLEMDTAEQTAAGIVELADETMANAARIHGVELGLDVSEFDLLVSGGGGGLHGARIAEKLGIGRVIIPDNAGVGSAIGFLRSVAAFESAISVVETINTIDAADLSKRIETTKAYVRNIVEEIVEPKQVSCNTVAELRYQGQGLEVALPLAGHGELDLGDLVRSFEQRYREIVGFTLPKIPIELISISVRAFEVREKSVTKFADQSKGQADKCYREVYDQHSKEFLIHRVVERRALGTQCLHGPLIVTEPQTSTLVKSGWKVQQSKSGHLILERKAS